jgi:hypothetical protein
MILVYTELSKSQSTLAIQKKVISLLPSDVEIVTNESLFRNMMMVNQYKMIICVVESYIINQYIIDLYKTNQLFAQGTFLYVKNEFVEISKIIKAVNHADREVVSVSAHQSINYQESFLDQIYPKSDTIFLKDITGTWKTIKHKNILCIEGKDIKSIIYTNDGQAIEVRTTQKTLIESLPSHFVRAHRSFYVNKIHISEINRGFIHLSNGFRIPFSKTFSSQFIQTPILQIGA